MHTTPATQATTIRTTDIDTTHTNHKAVIDKYVFMIYRENAQGPVIICLSYFSNYFT